jgi:hypothetical protein
MSRRRWLGSLAGLGAGSVLVLPACEALQRLDTSAAAEGTGVQFTGLIKVLATYRASPRQQVVAQETARKAFVDRGMRPALAEAKKKARVRHQKQEAVARRETAGDPVKQQQAVAQVQQTAANELAAIDSSWQDAASRYTGGKYTADFAATKPTAVVAFAPIRESEILTASAQYVPRHFAVSVPAERAVAGAAAHVMFHDTRANQLAKNDVYAVDREPPSGKIAQIGDFSAEFIER